MKKVLLTILCLVLGVCLWLFCQGYVMPSVDKNTGKRYREIQMPTPNVAKARKNKVNGVVLHHTASFTVGTTLNTLLSPNKHLGAHCVIDYDGTRYILCEPEAVTFHAGESVLNGRAWCNNFTIGIEFQGSTDMMPLTRNQIQSAIEYLRPILAKHNIPVSNIVTHEMVRDAYKKMYPDRKCNKKIDITQKEYKRFMKELKKYN